MFGVSRSFLAWLGVLGVILVGGCSSSDTPTEPEPEPEPDVTVASVIVTPDAASFAALGDTVRFAAVARNAAGEVLAPNVAWSSTAASIVAVDTAGLAESVGVGEAEIIATAEGIADTASVTVTLHTLVWAAAIDGSWHDPANWRGGVVPAAGDTARITATGNYQVTLAADAEVARLVLGGPGGTQRLDTATSALTVSSFVMDGAELRIGETAVVSDLMAWKGGAVVGPGTLTVTAGAELQVGGGSPFPELEARLFNEGTVAVVSSARFDVATTGVIESPAGSVIDFRSDGAILPYDGGAVVSAGTVRKSAGVGVAAFGVSSGAFTVTGNVEIESGALRIAGGEVLCPVDIAPDARLEVLGAITLAGDVSFPNSGALDIDGSVTIGLDAGQTITIPYLTMHSGIVGGVADIAVTDSLVWVRGGIAGEGEVRVGVDATARLVGDAFSKSLAGRDLIVHGELTAGSALDLLLEQGAHVAVESTGRWDHGYGGQIRQSDGSGSTFRVDGVFTKRDDQITSIGVPMTCAGSLFLDDGTLVVSDGFSLTETGLIRGGGQIPNPGDNLRLDLRLVPSPVLAGTIEPDHGGQAAQLDIAGEVVMTATTVVRIDIAEDGEIRGERLIFSESVVMDGTLEIVRALTPQPAETFLVVSTIYGTGQFAALIGDDGFDVTMDSNGTRLYWPPPPR